MVSGEEPTVHKITWDWDDYKPEKGFIAVPTVFSVAKGAGLRTVMVVGKRKLQHLAPPGTVDTFVLAERGDTDVANEAIVQAGTGFALLFVHFPDVDLTGHCEGWMSAAYLETLARLDDALGRLLAALPPETTVILTADHGGKGRTHGRAIAEDTTVPWIVAGPKVTRRGAMTAKVMQIDTAATALWMLGLRLPSGCAGAVVQEPFAAP
jgi:phosphopentomutase